MLGGLEAGQTRGTRTPSKVSGVPSPIRIATEPLRMDPRRSQRVSEVYSPLILKLVRRLVSPLLGAYDHGGIGPSPITGPQVGVSDESSAGISSGGSGFEKW